MANLPIIDMGGRQKRNNSPGASQIGSSWHKARRAGSAVRTARKKNPVFLLDSAHSGNYIGTLMPKLSARVQLLAGWGLPVSTLKSRHEATPG
jgi:hypothetical protein